MEAQSQVSGEVSQEPLDDETAVTEKSGKDEEEAEATSERILKFFNNLDIKERVTIVAGSTVIIILCGLILRFLWQIRALKQTLALVDLQEIQDIKDINDIHDLSKIWTSVKTEAVEHPAGFSPDQLQHITSIF